MKSMIKKYKIFILVFLFMFLCLVYLASNTLFTQDYSKEKTVDTLKSNSNSEIISLSFNNYENEGQVGKTTRMSICAKLGKDVSFAKNVAYIIECKKDGTDLLDKDVTLTYGNKKLIFNKGRYELVREAIVDKETIYDLKLVFNNEGTYDINVYAEIYNE